MHVFKSGSTAQPTICSGKGGERYSVAGLVCKPMTFGSEKPSIIGVSFSVITHKLIIVSDRGPMIGNNLKFISILAE